MTYCPSCMRPAAGETCPHCGGRMDLENNAFQLPVGTVLTGGSLGHSYQIGRALGQGGFGITYIGLDLTSGERVAIKEYFPTRCAQRDGSGAGDGVAPQQGQEAAFMGGRYSFVKEAVMLSSLEGMPAVVQGLDYLETNGTAYLIMEYLDGSSLRQLVEGKGRILAEELLPRLRPLMEDIGKLHHKNVIHRDIAPDNIMWLKDGALKLMDFGCARSVEDGRSLTLMHKKGFAPIEQYRSRGQGSWTDVYALAATIYYCLTGAIPTPATERMLDGAELKSPISLGAAVTPEEEGALLWGLTVEPAARPINMEVFAQRLFPIPIATGGNTVTVDDHTTGIVPPPPPPAPAGPFRRLLAWLKNKLGR